MSKRMTYTSLIAGLMLPLAASSAPLDYNFLDLQYANDDVKPNGHSSISADGWQLNGSAAFADNFYVTGRYSDTSKHGDLKRTSVGVGYDAKVADATSAYGQITYENLDANSSTDGFGLEGGLRYAINDQFEVNGGLEYIDISDSIKKDGIDLKSEFGGRIGGMYEITPAFAAVASYEFLSKLDGFRIGVRWNWGV